MGKIIFPIKHCNIPTGVPSTPVYAECQVGGWRGHATLQEEQYEWTGYIKLHTIDIHWRILPLLGCEHSDNSIREFMDELKHKFVLTNTGLQFITKYRGTTDMFVPTATIVTDVELNDDARHCRVEVLIYVGLDNLVVMHQFIPDVETDKPRVSIERGSGTTIKFNGDAITRYEQVALDTPAPEHTEYYELVIPHDFPEVYAERHGDNGYVLFTAEGDKPIGGSNFTHFIRNEDARGMSVKYRGHTIDRAKLVFGSWLDAPRSENYGASQLN